MGFRVYDYRKDIINLLVTSEIRSRFMRMEPGEAPAPHSHDLGHEVFLVLQGRADFEIDGETKELGPGQMCVALVDQMHSIRVLGDEAMIMYLSVTPHIQPTHTMWTGDGQQLPHRFVPSSAYDVETDTTTPFAELVDKCVKAVQAVADASAVAAEKEAELASTVKRATARGDDSAASDARSDMWDALFPVFKLVGELGTTWNDLAPRAGKTR